MSIFIITIIISFFIWGHWDLEKLNYLLEIRRILNQTHRIYHQISCLQPLNYIMITEDSTNDDWCQDPQSVLAQVNLNDSLPSSSLFLYCVLESPKDYYSFVVVVVLTHQTGIEIIPLDLQYIRDVVLDSGCFLLLLLSCQDHHRKVQVKTSIPNPVVPFK